jgi:hypothetical protein
LLVRQLTFFLYLGAPIVHSLKEAKVKKTKKTKKLEIKKVTLRNLDEPTLDAMAGGYLPHTNAPTCSHVNCLLCP